MAMRKGRGFLQRYRLHSFVTAAMFAASLSASTLGTPRAEFRGLYQLGPEGHIVIQNLYGNVSITAWDRDDVLVEATKHSTDSRRLNDAQVVVDSTGGLVSIHTQYTGTDAEHPASVEYHIMVPRRANLDNVRLINGGLSIRGVTGPVKASSVNGSIRAEKLEGQTELSTVNGRLDADFQRVDKAQAITLSSVNGPIRLSLPNGAGATVSAHNLSGGIDADFGRVWRAPDGHRLQAAVNGGGAPVQVKNVNGGISIQSTWGRRSLRPAS
jgi:DUF4097 and DUF4098 domain-containing protein YvlB